MKNKKVLKGVLISLGVFFGLFLMLMIAFVVLGTSRYKSDMSKTSDMYYGQSIDGFSGTSMIAPRAELEYGADTTGSFGHSFGDRDLIKTGRISVAVDDIDGTLERVTEIQRNYDALTMDLGDYGKGINRRVSITIKVEVSRFEQLYESLRTLEGEFESSSISVTDVTDTIMDLEARLKNYKSVEAQYLTILESAENVEETLSVYKELNQVRLEIERVEAQLKNLGTQTEYSYIYIYVSQSSAGAEIADDEWRPEGVLTEAIRALVCFGKSIASVLIWILVFSPVIAIVVLPILHLRKRGKK
jgi:hypothetical protein